MANKKSDSGKDIRFKENIYILKALAIISVICAHCCGVGENSSVLNTYASAVLESVGTVGVFVFYFLSGYFLCFTGKKIKEFWKQKLFSVIIPWVFCGTVVYFYVYLRNGGLSFISWVKWILGMDTYLYYIVVLLMFYLLFYFLRRNKVFIVIFTLLSVAENILLFVIPEEVFVLRYPYLDPLRFGYMFSLGSLIANYDILAGLMSVSKRFVILTGILSSACILIPAGFGFTYSYFTPWYIPFALLSFMFLLGLCQYILKFLVPITTNTGRWSYTIYLIHMPVAGIIAYIGNRIDNPIVTLIRPALVLVIVYVFLMAVIWVTKKAKVSKITDTLLGLR